MDHSTSPYPPPYPPPPVPPPADTRLRIGAVIRDLAIFWGLTLAGGFVIGLVSATLHPGVRPSVMFLALSNLALGLVAFTIAGSIVAPTVRWKHLVAVALLSWLTSLLNVAFFHVTLIQWAFGAFFIALLMGLGGVISYLFNPDRRPPA